MANYHPGNNNYQGGGRQSNNRRNGNGQRNSNGQGNNRPNGGRQGNASSYVGAPYNFVSLGEKVVSYDKKELPAHNSFKVSKANRKEEELFSGEIRYTVTAQTDIFVGGSNGKEFYRSIDGSYALPGSSVRGLVRGNMQILGMSSIADDVDDYKLMYRKVADRSPLGREYSNILGVKPVPVGKGKSISVCTKVQAGYLFYDGSHYILIEIPGGPCNHVKDSKQNYYTLREPAILQAYEKTNNTKGDNPYAYLIEIANKHLMYRTKPNPFLSGGNVVKGSNNPHYCPSVYAISFKIGSNNQIERVAKPGELTGNHCHEGYILSSGFMHKKKTHYIIPGIDGIDLHHVNLKELETKGIHSIRLKDEAITSYKHDYEAKKNLLGATLTGVSKNEKKEIQKELQDFYALPRKKGECRPVFYIKLNDKENKIHFGFTPYQRLFYEHTVVDGIPRAHKEAELDYTEAILGYSKRRNSGNESRKSRVSFEDARQVLPKGKTAEALNLVCSPVQPILASPKPTSYLDYVTQRERELVTYNNSNFTLRGYKQYWLHQEAAATQSTENDKQAAAFRPLKSGSSFQGTIRFKNLYAEELGLLLWSLRLEKNSQQNLGKAKAYGFGRVRIVVDDLKLLDLKKMYDSLTLDFSPYKDSAAPDKNPSDSAEEAVEKWIQLYKEKISRKLGEGKDIMDETSIRQFLLMKDGDKFPDETKIRYMSINDKEYQNRKKALPFPEEVLGMESLNAGRINARPEPTVKKQVQVKVDAIVTGKVKNIAAKKGRGAFGVYVSLPENHQGLLHESKMAHPLNDYTVGKNIEVKITGITEKGISLTDVGV